MSTTKLLEGNRALIPDSPYLQAFSPINTTFSAIPIQS
jgi:hypothetical protein